MLAGAPDTAQLPGRGTGRKVAAFFLKHLQYSCALKLNVFLRSPELEPRPLSETLQQGSWSLIEIERE